jgi:hypothetical protein
MTNSGNRPEEFNPALLPHPECNAAKYWELLRRNKKFQKISEMFSKNTHEIKKHHINNISVACCLYWMLSENYLNPEDNDAHNSEVKFWRPDQHHLLPFPASQCCLQLLDGSLLVFHS